MISPEILLQLYRVMVRIRTTEESLVDPILRREFLGPAHLYSGQEAVAAGVMAHLGSGDVIFGNHRSHGHYLAKGGSVRDLLAEVFCREGGCSRGRGGSMHLIGPEFGMLGSVPIVSGTVSLAAGAALAKKRANQGEVAVSFFGDGALGEGVVYESMNFASILGLPALFVCENNLYSTHMPIERCRARGSICGTAQSFGLLARQVDGNDVEEVYTVAGELIAAARRGQPGFLECLTYRYRGHVGPDDNIQGVHTDIRPAAERAAWSARDPIPRLRAKLLGVPGVGEAQLVAIERECAAEVKEALAYARDGRGPDPKSLGDYLFV